MEEVDKQDALVLLLGTLVLNNPLFIAINVTLSEKIREKFEFYPDFCEIEDNW